MTDARVGWRQGARQCLELSWRSIVKIRDNPLVMADVLIGPAVFLVLFVYVFGGAIQGSSQAYLQFVLPGILGLTTLLATMGVGVSLNTDVQKGVFDRLRSLPILRIAPLIGAIGGDVVRQLVAIVALIAFGVVLGFRFQGGIWPALAACLLAVTFAMALSWVWVLLGLAMRDAQSVQGLGAVLIFPLSFASNMFVDPASMPGWLQAFVAVNPVRHLLDAMRGLMLGGPVARPVLWTVLWMAGFVLVFAPLALMAYRRRS